MLLAAVNLPGSISASDIENTAIQTDDPQISVTLDPTGTLLQIDGPHHGNLTLDLSKLPAAITYLQVSDFENVTFVGEHDVTSVVIKDIQDIDAGHIAIQSTLQALGVDHIKIDEAPAYVFLEGSDGMPDIGAKTLFEVGEFSSSPDAFIFAWLQSLGLATTSHVVRLPSITAAPNETIFLNFQPDLPPTTSTLAEVSVITGNNFEEYFFASPIDQASLEQSLLFSRHPITVDYVPLGTLLNESGVQVTLSGNFDAHENIALRSWMGNEPALLQHGFGAKIFPEHVLIGEASTGAAEVHDLVPAADFGLAISKLSLVPDRPVAVESHPVTVSEFFNNDLQIIAHSTGHVDSVLSHSPHLATPAYAEPLTDLVGGLGAHIATFGDLAAIQVTEHLQIDHQFALLVDARPVRPASERDLLILAI